MSTRLAAFLIEHRIKQSSVARAVGLDPSQVNRSIHGTRSMSVDEAARVLSYLSSVLHRRVEFDEVFGASEDVVDPELAVKS